MAASENPGSANRLSAVLFVHQRPDLAAESLLSIQPIADEIVVLSAVGDSAELHELVRVHDAKHIPLGQTDDFAAAKNRALSTASGNWVLWIESGERLEDPAALPLRRFVDSLDDAARVYMLTVVLPALDPTVSAEQMAQPRLMPNVPSLRFEGRVRETLVPAMERTCMQIDTAPGRLLCSASFRETEHRHSKARRDLALCRAELTGLATPRAEVLVAQGEAHSELGEFEAAREAFQRALEAAAHGSTTMLEAYYGLLTTFDEDAEQHDRQLAVCLEALEIYPLDAQLLCAMGSYLQRREQLSLARRAFETAVRYGQVDMETWHLTEIAEVSAVCYALTLQLEGNEEEAHRQLREAGQRYPNSQRVWRAQLELSIKLGDDDRAAALVREPFVDRQQQPTLTDAVRGACRAAEEDWTAAIGLLQSAYAAGCRHPICLRGLAVTLLSNGQVDAVGPILKLWLSQEPENAEANAYLQAMQQAARTQSVDVGAADSQRSVRIDAGGQPADSPPSQLPNLGQISTHDVHAEDGP